MRPPFGSRANSIRTRSMSAASRTPAAVTVIPNEVEGFGNTDECDICGYFRNVDDGRPTHPWRDLLEHAQPFPAHCGFKIMKSGHVSARMREARDVSASD